MALTGYFQVKEDWWTFTMRWSCTERPSGLTRALTSQADLEAWMDAPALAAAEVGGLIEFHYDQGRRLLKVEITRLEPGQSVGWRVIQPTVAQGGGRADRPLDAFAL